MRNPSNIKLLTFSDKNIGEEKINYHVFLTAKTFYKIRSKILLDGQTTWLGSKRRHGTKCFYLLLEYQMETTHDINGNCKCSSKCIEFRWK